MNFLPEVDLSFMSEGVKVIQNEILNLVLIVALTMVALFFLFKFTNMPNWLRKIIFPIVTIGVFVVSVIKIYLPNIVTQLGLN